MKRPQPDISETLRNELIGNLKTTRSLLRLWGTEFVNGVEVFTPRQFYHKESDRSVNFEKLFKFLGSYKEVIDGNYEGLRSAWFYFNRNKGREIVEDYSSFVSTNLNKMWWDTNDGPMPQGLTLTTSIVIEGYSSNVIDNARIQQLLNTSMPESTAAASIAANYEELWNIAKITQEGVGIINKGSIVDVVNSVTIPDEDDLTPDDPWLNTIARYALRTQGIPCTIKKVSIGTIQKNNKPSVQDFFTTYVVDIEIPYIAFSPTDPIVVQIETDLTAIGLGDIESNKYMTNKVIKTMDSTDLENDPDLVSRNYILLEDQTTANSAITDSLWFEFNGSWYLRAAPFRNPKSENFTYKKLNNYILQLIDNGYKKKKVPWYKKAIAVVLVVIAIVLTVISVGKATGAAAKILAVAMGILASSLTLTLLILAFSVLGMYEWASVFMQVSKAIEPLVLIATIVAVITGFYIAVEKTQALQAAAKKAAEETGKDFIEKSVVEIALDIVESRIVNAVDEIAKGAVDVFSGSFFTDSAKAFSNKMFKLINMELDSRTRSLQQKNVDLKAEYEKLREEAEKETDALKSFAKIYARPATADWSIFASLFDLPYERGGGNLAIGNIQRTTKQALRKAEYTDPAFTGILII